MAGPVRRCVLVVDDNDINRLVIGRMLDVIGHDHRLAGDGREAIAAVAAGGVDLVLMDVQMPELDGLDATRAIRAAESAGVRVPVVGVSAHSLDEDRATALAAGMDDYLIKPLMLNDLRRCMAIWLP